MPAFSEHGFRPGTATFKGLVFCVDYRVLSDSSVRRNGADFQKKYRLPSETRYLLQYYPSNGDTFYILYSFDSSYRGELRLNLGNQ